MNILTSLSFEEREYMIQVFQQLSQANTELYAMFVPAEAIIVTVDNSREVNILFNVALFGRMFVLEHIIALGQYEPLMPLGVNGLIGNCITK